MTVGADRQGKDPTGRDGWRSGDTETPNADGKTRIVDAAFTCNDSGMTNSPGGDDAMKRANDRASATAQIRPQTAS